MRWLAALTAYCVLGIGYAPAADKPVPTKDAAARMTVPEGFRVSLFAGEPDVVQPIAFTFDDRGRMWVVECVTYPKWLQPGQTGKDRVIILEDTNGDGVHDKKTVVLDDGFNLSGIELGFGGVYLCSTPNLVFVPIKDDKPAGPPQVLLDGWNLKEAKHNVFNGLAWGPDGWLYGANGIQTKSWVGAPGTPQDKRTYIDCGVWRFHPTKKTFEVVATGTTNPWGVDWDSHGELFITNCVIDHLWHVQPGGRYTRMYGQDSNPYSFGLMGPANDHRHWAGGHWTDSRADKATGAVQKGHDDAGGGHAHSGVCVYNGDNFPPEYRDCVFTCNIHGNRLNRDRLHRTDAGYVGKHEKDFLNANDPWFRGVCVKAGPDGGLYVADWCDTGECHNYDVADTTNGRIYRVIYGSRKTWSGDVSKLTDTELWTLHESKNEWLVRQARRVLLERAVAGRLKSDYNPGHLARDLSPAALRRYWTHAALGWKPGIYGGNFAPVPFRVWSARLAVEMDLGDKLPHLAADESPAVRSAVAGAMAKLPPAEAFSVASKLLTRDADNAHADLCQMYWLGVQPAVLADPAAGLKLLPDVRIRRVRSSIARLVCSLPNSDPTKQLEQVLPLLSVADAGQREDILAGILQAFDDRKQVSPPAKWADVYPKLAADASPAVHERTTDLALKLGDQRAMVALVFQATHHKEPTARVRAIERLAPLRGPGYQIGELLRGLLTDPAVRGAAVRGLSHHPGEKTAPAILAVYPQFTAAEKADAVLTLASRKEFAGPLLDAVAAGAIPKTDVTAFAVRQLLALNDKALTARLGQVWGTIQPASATRTAQTKRLKGYLIPDRMSAANLSNGRAVYVKSCAACHKLFGEGGDVGPELTGSQRANLDYVLENVLDPNAAVPFDYKMTAFSTNDGRVVTGLVRKETPQAVTVRTANEELLLPTADIESRKPTNNSVMPEGLLDAMKDEEIRDLIAYLAAKQQVPLK